MNPGFCGRNLNQPFGTRARRLGAVLVCLPLVAGNPLHASESSSPPQKLSLAQALSLAFQNNWELLAARCDIRAAQAQTLVSREFPNPTLSLLSSKINLDHGSGTIRGNGLGDRSYDSIAAVNQLLEIGGKRQARRDSAGAGLASTEARFQDALRLLELGVARAYILALQSEANATILSQSAASLGKEARIAGTRRQAGDISTADELQITLTAARLEQDARTAWTTSVANKVALENLLGLAEPKGDWQAADTLEALAGEKLSGWEDAPLAMVERRPDVLAAEANRRRAEADWRLQRAMRIPDPTITVQYEREPPDTLDSLGLGISFPLPLWNHNRGGIQAAAAAREQATTLAAKVRAQAVTELFLARNAYKDATERYDRYRTEIGPKSAQVLESVAFAFSRGGAALLDLLAAERTDNEVRLATTQAAADVAGALASLRAALCQTNKPTTP